MGALVATVIALCAAVTPALAAKDATAEHRFLLEPSLIFGDGLDESVVGVADDGETTDLSGGGGVGTSLGFGYQMKKLELGVTLGFQESELSESADNMDATFDRSFLMAALKYRIPVLKRGSVKVGGGVGMYMSGEVDIDVVQGPADADVMVYYDDELGFHFSAEFDNYFAANWSWHAGLRYEDVEYQAERYVRNGLDEPVAMLKDEWRDFDGTAVNVTAGVTWHF